MPAPRYRRGDTLIKMMLGMMMLLLEWRSHDELTKAWRNTCARTDLPLADKLGEVAWRNTCARTGLPARAYASKYEF